jgi:sRNA-binding regulator protein Hfq/Mn-dependent DtxR family transcriptional regulator
MKNEELFKLLNHLRKNIEKKFDINRISKSLNWPQKKTEEYLEELREIALLKREKEGIYFLSPNKRLNLWLTLASQHEWRSYLQNKEEIIKEVIEKLISEIKETLSKDILFIIYYGENNLIEERIIKLFTVLNDTFQGFFTLEKIFNSIYLNQGIKIKGINSDLKSFTESLKEEDENMIKSIFKNGKIIYGHDNCWDLLKRVFLYP